MMHIIKYRPSLTHEIYKLVVIVMWTKYGLLHFETVVLVLVRSVVLKFWGQFLKKS